MLLSVLGVGIASSLVLPARSASRTQQTQLAATAAAAGVPGASPTYDHIVVGAGIAGCVLANRLSADGTRSVLLLEAGSGNYKNKFMRIPAGVLRLFQSAFDWKYFSSPEKNCDDREIYLCRGKCVGGSGQLNVLLYNRGDANDYDSWASEAGLAEWSSDQCLPFFRTAEREDPSRRRRREKRDPAQKANSQALGSDGEVSISDVPYQNPLSKAYLRACDETGLSMNDDFNDWSRPQEGAGRYALMQRNGERSGPAITYLQSARGRDNLDVCSDASVRRVTFDGTKATGVEYDLDGTTHTAKLADAGEVVLAAGAIGSPHLLQLSGVGPSAHLKDHGIDVVADSPCVGTHLQDHPAAVVSYELEKQNGISVTSKLRLFGSKYTNPVPLVQWLFGKGPLTSTGCDHGGFFRTPSAEAATKAASRADADKLEGGGWRAKSPNLQMRFLAARALSADGMSTFAKFREGGAPPDGYSFQSIVARPRSAEGTVRLSSADPSVDPAISMSYLSSQHDVNTLVDGIKMGRELQKADAFAKFGAATEVFPGADVTSDEDLAKYVRSSLHTSNAIAGSCRMANTKEEGVVDGRMKVHGVQNLRVVDSSVTPRIPGGQTGAVTYMMAERAAKFIMDGGDAPVPAVAEEPAALATV